MLETCAVCGGERFPVGRRSTRSPFAGIPIAAARSAPPAGRAGGRSAPVVRLALARLAATAVDAPVLEALPADVNRGGREAILEIVKLHISGPLQSLEFIAKMGGHP